MLQSLYQQKLDLEKKISNLESLDAAKHGVMMSQHLKQCSDSLLYRVLKKSGNVSMKFHLAQLSNMWKKDPNRMIQNKLVSVMKFYAQVCEEIVDRESYLDLSLDLSKELR